jgi:hypothetical protein
MAASVEKMTLGLPSPAEAAAMAAASGITNEIEVGAAGPDVTTTPTYPTLAGWRLRKD